SPRRTLKSLGGKNSEKRSTRMPTAFATAKCPSSCRMISRTMPRIVRTQLMPTSVPRRPRSSERSDGLRRVRAREQVGLIQRLEVAHGLRAELLERPLDDLGDAQERGL